MGANDASPKTDVTARGILHRHKNWIQVTWNICSIINKTMQWSMRWNVCHLGMKLIGFILWNVKWIVLFRHHSSSGWPSTHRHKTISIHNAGSKVTSVSVKFHLLSLHWRHSRRNGVSNHQPRNCLPNCVFRRRSKKTSKLRVTGLCAGDSPGTGEFPAQMTNYAENVSIWWRHHAKLDLSLWSSTCYHDF